MTVDGAAVRLKTEADEPGWEVDPDDEWGLAVIATVGRQLKLRREAVGMWAAEFGTVLGYGEDMVYKIEGGKRIPRPEYLDKADEVIVKDVHVCCMRCQTSIMDLFKDATVSFDGTKAQKTVKISGKGLDRAEVLEALRKAGYNGTVEK